MAWPGSDAVCISWANLHGKVAAKQIPPVMAAVKTIFAHTEPEAIHEQWNQVVDTLEPSFPKVSEMMREANADVLAFTAFGEGSLAEDLVQQSDRAAQ